MEQQTNKHYPIGISSFPEIREKGLVYIDKTDLIYKLTHWKNSDYFFLSRPPKFGKTLLISTLEAYFHGCKDLFKGLAIGKLETEWKEYPVLRFDLSAVMDTDKAGLEAELIAQISRYEKEYGCIEDDKYTNIRINELVRHVHEITGRKAVVLIDSYDTPVLGLDFQSEACKQLWNALLNFLAPFKGLASHLEFFFMTGLTRFADSMLTGILNNLYHITTHDEYATICGISREELETQLGDEIGKISNMELFEFEDASSVLRRRYGGYRFAWPSPEILNPHSLFNALSEKKLGNYMFANGLPDYLTKSIRLFGGIPRTISGLDADSYSFDTPIEMMYDMTPLLYQSGCLSIQGYSKRLHGYFLDIPNTEVYAGLIKGLLAEYFDPTKRDEALNIVDSFFRGW